MSTIPSWATIALTVVIGSHGARAQTRIPPAPNDFLMAAAQSDHYETMAAHVAEVQGQNPHVRALAEEMIRDHTRLSEDLRKAAMASHLPLPGPGMSSDQAAWVSALQNLRGVDFDEAYARRQELAHAQAVTLEGSFAAAGADANLKKAAQTAFPTIQDQLKMTQQLRVEVGGR